jgi:deoxyribose-phosphate aldolase
MKLTNLEIARMVDLSAVQAQDDEDYIRSLVACAKKYRSIAVIPLPSHVPLVRELLEDDHDILIGGAVGFPSGGQTTATKVFETYELIAMGCREMDMVINISELISGRTDKVLDDIRAVVDACNGIPLKVILECHYLTEAQILKGCDLCIEAGANWVKTGTGWAKTGATIENISLIKAHVGDAIGVKAAGGVRDLETLLGMYLRGARRFGVGLKSGIKILEQAYAVRDGILDTALFDQESPKSGHMETEAEY